MVQAATAKTSKAELKTFGKPDEVREFPKGRLELIKVGGATIGRAIFEPGWRWATSVQPIAKTQSCEAPHFQYHVAGVLRIKMDDGAEFVDRFEYESSQLRLVGHHPARRIVEGIPDIHRIQRLPLGLPQ